MFTEPNDCSKIAYQMECMQACVIRDFQCGNCCVFAIGVNTRNSLVSTSSKESVPSNPWPSSGLPGKASGLGGSINRINSGKMSLQFQIAVYWGQPFLVRCHLQGYLLLGLFFLGPVMSSAPWFGDHMKLNHSHFF